MRRTRRAHHFEHELTAPNLPAQKRLADRRKLRLVCLNPRDD